MMQTRMQVYRVLAHHTIKQYSASFHVDNNLVKFTRLFILPSVSHQLRDEDIPTIFMKTEG